MIARTKAVAQSALASFDIPHPDPFKLEFEDRRIALKADTVVDQKLGVLVRGSLYVATEKVVDSHQDEQIVWPGNILSRNLELTKRKGYDPDGAVQAYQVYRNVYEFLRGVAQAEDWYDRVELPFLSEAGRSVQLLQQASWMVGRGGIEAVEGHREAGAGVRETFDGKPRNEHKVAAQDKAVRGATLEDKRGRINAGRSSMLSGAARQDLAKRLDELPSILIGLSRRHAVAAMLVDDVYAELARFDDANVAHLSRRDEEWTSELREHTARNIEAYAERIKGMIVSPFHRSFGHQQDDFAALAAALRRNDLPATRQLFDKGHRVATCLYRMRDFQECMVPISLLEKEVIALTRDGLDDLVADISRTRIPKGFDRDFKTKVVDDFNDGVDVIIDCLIDAKGPHYDQAYEVGDGLHKLH